MQCRKKTNLGDWVTFKIRVIGENCESEEEESDATSESSDASWHVSDSESFDGDDEPEVIKITKTKSRTKIHIEGCFSTRKAVLGENFVEVFVDGDQRWYCAKVVRGRSDGTIRIQDIETTKETYERMFEEGKWRPCKHYSQ